MLRVGLTGGIASGKSHVAARFAADGLRTLDLDRVGHEVIARDGPAYADVVAAFGPGIVGPGNAIDRKALGRLVFADPAARARLNALVHPRIRAEETRLLAASHGASVVVIEAALLVETGQHLRFDRLVVAHCGSAEQQRRLVSRDGLDETAAVARLAAQMPPEDKRRFAHRVVDTSGSVAETNREADRVAEELLALAAAGVQRRLDVERAPALAYGGPRVGPAGLTAEALVEEMAGGLDLDRLAQRLLPPPSPWYAASVDHELGPEAFAGPVALYGLLRRGDDPEYTAGAAYSLARLTHASALAHSRAVLFALAVQAAALGVSEPAGPRERRLAERFGSPAPGPETCRAAATHAAALIASTPSVSPREKAALERLLALRA